jgi:hypothetical protein
VAAALIGATAFTVWNQSVVNEKVYTVSLAFFAIVSWLVVRWCDEPDAPKADRLLVLAAYLIGLGYTNHPAGLLVGPAVAAGVLLRRPSRLLNWRLLTKGALAFALGLTPFLYQPIRAAHFPEINEGEPTACTTQIGFDCTFDKTTWTRLKANIDREQYGKPSLTERQAPFTGRSTCGGPTSAGSGSATRTTSTARCRAPSPCSSSRSVSSAGTRTGSATSRASGSSARWCSR